MAPSRRRSRRAIRQCLGVSATGKVANGENDVPDSGGGGVEVIVTMLAALTRVTLRSGSVALVDGNPGSAGRLLRMCLPSRWPKGRGAQTGLADCDASLGEWSGPVTSLDHDELLFWSICSSRAKLALEAKLKRQTVLVDRERPRLTRARF